MEQFQQNKQALADRFTKQSADQYAYLEDLQVQSRKLKMQHRAGLIVEKEYFIANESICTAMEKAEAEIKKCDKMCKWLKGGAPLLEL
jgi:hypothetical protein